MYSIKCPIDDPYVVIPNRFEAVVLLVSERYFVILEGMICNNIGSAYVYAVRGYTYTLCTWQFVKKSMVYRLKKWMNVGNIRSLNL